MGDDRNLAKAIFLAAIEDHAPAQWPAFLDQACAGDRVLRAQVEDLLRAQAAMGSFHEGPRAAPLPTLDEPVHEHPGTVIGPYKLLEEIGEGGFGRVFMALQQEPMRRTVALKVLKPGMDTRQVVARFEAERQALALMDHAHIARVLDGGETSSGRPYFVMELVRGAPVTDFCDQNRLTIRARLELFVCVCQAVQHAHQKGVIHRDLKPSNVLVTWQDDRPMVKVIDFGIAKALGQPLTDKTLFTNFAQMIGTPLYMSPEQAQLSAVDVDTRSDLYSLGVLVYELLTGATPFDQERLRTAGYDEIRRIIRDEEPVRPSTRMSTVRQATRTASANRRSDPRRLSQLFRGELDWIVMKALEKDRNRRYESASAFAADVERYLHDEPVQACPPSTWYRVRKLARRHKAGALTAAVVGVSLVLGTVISTWQGIRATQAEGLAQTRLEELDHANRDLTEANRALEANLYFKQIALAERELAVNHAAGAWELLEACRPDERGWEWYLLRRHIHEEPLALTDDARGFCSVAFSPEGRVLASASFDGTVRLWNPGTGQLLGRLSGEPPGFFRVAFSPDGRLLAAVNLNGSVSLWERSSMQERQWKTPVNRGAGLAFSPDSQSLATSANRTVTLWKVRTGAQTVLSAHEDAITAIAYSPDGTRLATASEDRTVRVWDVRTGQALLCCTGHQDGVHAVAFSPDGRTLASTGRDRSVRLWNAGTGAALRVLKGHTSEGGAVLFSPDGRRLVSAADDGTVRLWVPATGQHILTLREHAGPVADVAFSPDGRRLASAGGGPLDRTIRVWNAAPVEERGPEPLRTFAGHTQDVKCLALSRDGSLLASGSADRTVRVCHATTGAVVQVLAGREVRAILGVAFNADGTCLAAASEDGIVDVWHLLTGREIWGGVRRLSSNWLFGIAASPDGRRLAVADSSGRVHLLDAASGQGVGSLDRPQASVTAVAYRPDGKYLAAAFANSTIEVWDTRSAGTVTLRGHEAGINAVAYRGDGRSLASGDRAGWVLVWDATSAPEATLVRRIRAHRDQVNGVAFSPDGRRLASASRDGTVKLWEVTTGARLWSVLTGQKEVNNVVFYPDGRTLASAGADGTVKVWEVPR